MNPDEQKKLCEITGKENLNSINKGLGKIDACAKEKLFDLLRGRKELEEVFSSFEEYDITEMAGRFIKKILDYDGLECSKGGKYSLAKILDEISGINAEVSEVSKETESCKDFFQENGLSTFFSSAFDVFELSLNAYEKLSMTLQRLNYVDGYHFLNMVTWLRNKQKGASPSERDLEIIEFVFELFSFGIEALIAQLKFLLEISGESRLAENIHLKYVEEIKMPRDLERPKPENLRKFYEKGKSPEGDGYSLYHLGVSGSQGKDQKGIMLHSEFVDLNKNKGAFHELP